MLNTIHGNVIYVAAFVTDVEALARAGELHAACAHIPINRAHHMTLAFKPDFEYLSALYHDFDGISEFSFEVDRLYTGYVDRGAGVSGDIAAVTLRGADGQSSTLLDYVFSGVPHITLGVDTGIPPALSVPVISGEPHEDILETANHEVIGTPLGSLTIKTRLGWFDGRRPRFNNPTKP